MTDRAVLPQHLDRPRPGVETFGTLRHTGHHWVIEGDPQVIVMAKRLFPGSEGKGAGYARFPLSRRLFPDLVWFMQRFPLVVEDPAAWEAAYQEACAHTAERQRLLDAPTTAEPGPIFQGQLRPFQGEGLAWMTTNRRTLLADEMGLGKTVAALALMGTLQEWPALLVVPPHLIRHWQSKSEQFLRVASGGEMPLFSAEDGRAVTIHTIRGTRVKDLPKAHIYLTHYLLLRHWRRALMDLGIRTLVFDEIQELRHSGTDKYSAASEVAQAAPNAYGLSGTPIYNRGGEIWNVLNVLDYHCLGDWDSFTREWCNGYGNDTIKRPDLLGAHLRREGLMIRRRKEDVLGDLPPKRRIVESIDRDESLSLGLMKEAAALAKGAQGAVNVLERGRMEREAVSLTRQATGISKAPAVAVFLQGLLEAEEPTLVFAHHHAVVDRLMSDLAAHKPVCISGRETEAGKWAAQEAFRTGDTNLCIISLRSAAGIDGLQERARVVVFAELDWSPAVHSQAEDRAHRDGQRDSVLCYYLVTDWGTDPEMQEVLGLKVSQFLGLMGDRGETEADRGLAQADAGAHMRRVIEKLRKIA